MAKVRNWHKHESRVQLADLQPLSVVWGAGTIKVIVRNSDGKKLNIVLGKDEALTLVTRLTTGIHRIR